MSNEYGYQIARQGDQEVATLIVPGERPQNVPSDHGSFKSIVEALVSHASLEEVQDLFNLASVAARKFEALTPRVTVRGGTLFLDGDELTGPMGDLVVRMLQEGEEVQPFVKFIENIDANPGNGTPESISHTKEQALLWCQAARLDITEEGLVVGYKGVYNYGEGDHAYTSTSQGHAFVQHDGEIEEIEYGAIPQSIGSRVYMPRTEVAHDPGASCSTGLHVGTRSYAATFGNTTLRVLVDPRDIVSVPNGEHEKMRVSAYVVDGEEQNRRSSTYEVSGPVHRVGPSTPEGALGPNDALANQIAERSAHEVIDYRKPYHGETVIGMTVGGTLLEDVLNVGGSFANYDARYIVRPKPVSVYGEQESFEVDASEEPDASSLPIPEGALGDYEEYGEEDEERCDSCGNEYCEDYECEKTYCSVCGDPEDECPNLDACEDPEDDDEELPEDIFGEITPAHVSLADDQKRKLVNRKTGKEWIVDSSGPVLTQAHDESGAKLRKLTNGLTKSFRKVNW